MSIPIRHHYIPQFILRNFSMNDDNDVCYYDLKTKEISFFKTNDVFKVDNLYKDKINFPDYPVQIETDLAKYESEMALLINGKFLNDSNIEITEAENESLKLFLILMSFRSIHTFKTFGDSMAQNDKEFFSKWQPDGNFNDFWKRNLGYLANCRSLDDVKKHPKIDEPIKLFMEKDIFAFVGTYFVVCEKRGDTNFIIGDCYPLKLVGDSDFVSEWLLFYSFPISPSRMIILVANGAEYARQDVLLINKKILKNTTKISKGIVNIPVRKIYEEDVNLINNEIIKVSKLGYIKKND